MTSQSTNDHPQTVAAVERAFAVLQVLAEAEESMGVSAISRATGLPKSTASRLLGTLHHLEMVERVGNGRYRLGAGLAMFTPRATSSLVDLARPHLRELVNEIGEDASLAVSDGFEVLYVDQVQGEGAVQVQDWTGMRLPPHSVAAGCILMRSWSPERLTSYLEQPLEKRTDHTVVDPSAIRKRVKEWEHYVWTHLEFDGDVNGASAPVFASDGSIVAAVNLSGPAYRFPGDRSETELGTRLAEAAARISQHLAAIATP